MTKQVFSSALALVSCCLLLTADASGQTRRVDQQTGTTTITRDRQQGGGAFGQRGGPFGGQQGGPFGGQQGGAFSGQQGQRGQPGGFGQQRNNQGQGGFVGNDAQDMRNSFQNMSGRQRRRVMFDMMVENLNEMRDRRNRRDQRRRGPDPVRVQLRPSFNYPELDSSKVAETLQGNLARSSDLTGIIAPRVEIDGRTATISGFVPSEHERAVLEKMIAMQPGVSQVENQLTVDPFAPTTEPAPERSPVGTPATETSLESSAEPAAE